MGLFEYKKVWHSDLKKHSPLVVKFRTAPLVSKHVKDTTIIYFDTPPDVDDLEGKYYIIESEDIVQQLERVPKDVWLEVTATGGGPGDDAPKAVLEIKSVGGQQLSALPDAKPKSRNGTRKQVADAKEFHRESVVETYYEALRTAPLMLEMFNTEFDRDPTDAELALAQHMFAHWAIKGFDRPLYPGQVERDTKSYREAAEDESLPATQDQLMGIQSLARLKSKEHPEILEEVNKRIAEGITEAEADEILRDLAETAA